jgi:diguanylate cyclase (GGDEF)-like protein
MSFRTRLTSFFVVIVLAPMLAMGLLTVRLITQSNAAKAKARADGLASVADSLYRQEELSAREQASALLQRIAPLTDAQIRRRLATLPPGTVRVEIRRGRRLVLDTGSQDAVAPSVARITTPGGLRVAVSTTTAAGLAQALTGPQDAVVIWRGRQLLASTAPGHVPFNLSAHLQVGGTSYTATTIDRLPDFGGVPVKLAALSLDSATSSSSRTSQLVGVVFLGAFALLAFSFAVLASRGLQSQVARFLAAARRLGGGDFSSPVPVEGRDEFAQLATEFNNMSQQLEDRLKQLDAERQRLRESIRRGGETFAATLNEDALLPLALGTAIDGTEADFGRLTARSSGDGPLEHRLGHGRLNGLEAQVLRAEAAALASRGLGEVTDDNGVSVLAVPLGPWDALGRPLGLITVGRHGRPFTADDRDLLRLLVSQASMAIDNTRMHEEARRRATTDLLTELVNHGRFQELLSGELERARRYHYPVGLIMLDIDNFKQVNDTYGHPQGDLVLHSVARVLERSCREGDTPARYGGEELAMILPHTDLEGSYAIAERLRRSIGELKIPRVDGEGSLQVTVSIGVGASVNGPKEQLIAETDAALYLAKRSGKNRSERATSLAANAGAAE